ncbi:hypothetical protein BDQ17DRAFT_1361777 [Cyathus striatus]|nr:hypothetical protein BDQ17DRAFT_1361777 [Cyathus striatus]
MSALSARPVKSSGKKNQHSRSHYTLDINDIIVFPDIAHVPVLPPEPGESWYVLTEIKENRSEPDFPVFTVEDKMPGKYWKVAFFTDNRWEDSKDCLPKTLICIKNGKPKPFVDGTYGYYGIYDVSDFILLPCTMKKLREINEYLCIRYKNGLLLSCTVCNQPVQMGCGRCKTRYCSKKCQKQDWPTHKPICKIFKTLHIWNRTDWG